MNNNKFDIGDIVETTKGFGSPRIGVIKCFSISPMGNSLSHVEWFPNKKEDFKGVFAEVYTKNLKLISKIKK